MTRRCVFVTGGIGYMGRALIAALLGQGHSVRALARQTSIDGVPAGAEVVVGNALEAETFSALRLGLVTIGKMVSALVATIERGPQGVRILDVPAIRAADAG